MIKVETTEQPKKDNPEYPFIGKWKYGNMIVLFISEKCGTILQSSADNRPVGMHLTDFAMDVFKKYDAPITIINDN